MAVMIKLGLVAADASGTGRKKFLGGCNELGLRGNFIGKETREEGDGMEDAKSFDAFFRANHADVFRFVQRRVAIPDDAAELAGDVFRVLWQQYDPASEPSRAWMLGVARNLVLEHYRKAGRYTAALGRLIDQAALDLPPLTQVENDEHPVQEALDQLSEPAREILRLRYWEELDLKEVAEVLGITMTHARVRLHRARMRIRALLPDYMRTRREERRYG